METTNDIVRVHFERAVSTDTDGYAALFAPDAEVEDDGGRYHGPAEIRRWRSTVPPVSYDVLDSTGNGAAAVATASVSGDFPGSPVTLTYRFTLDDRGLIRRLTIRP